MNTRAFGGIVKRDLVRARKLFVLQAITLLAMVIVFIVPADYAIIPGVAALVVSFVGVMVPSLLLGTDKLQGFLEADCTLPVSFTLVAAARLTAAALMMLLVGMGTVPLLLAINRRATGGLGLLLLVAVPVATTILVSLISWTLLAYNARWSLRGLRFVVPFVAFGPQAVLALLPASAKEAVGNVATRGWDQVVSVAGDPVGQIGLLVLVIAFPVILFMGATMVFASGLARYAYDPSAINAMMEKAPKREMAAAGRGALLAVTRLRLRVSAERLRSQMLVVAVLVLFLFVGPPELRMFAKTYVKVIAFFLPAAVAGHLAAARQKGYLEGMQHLPHPSSTIALGHLLAIVLLAIPAAFVNLLVNISTHTAVTVSGMIGFWGWIVASTWLATVATLWLRKRHMVMLLVTFLGLMVWSVADVDVVANVVGDLYHRYVALVAVTGPAIPLTATFLAIVIGVPLFGRGLARYEFRGV